MCEVLLWNYACVYKSVEVILTVVGQQVKFLFEKITKYLNSLSITYFMWFEGFRLEKVVKAAFANEKFPKPRQLVESLRAKGFSEDILRNKLVAEVQALLNSRIKLMRKKRGWDSNLSIKEPSGKYQRPILKSLNRKRNDYVVRLRSILAR